MIQSLIHPWWFLPIALLAAFIIQFPTARVLIAAVVVGSVVMSLRLTSMQSADLDAFGESTNLIVRTDPTVVQSKSIFAKPSVTFLAKSAEGPVRVIAPIRYLNQLLPGQRIRAHAKALRTKENRVVALLIVRGEIEMAKEPTRLSKTLSAIRNGLRDASGSGDAGALIPGMVLGDTSKQSAEFKNEMRRVGLTHLVAVSGANFAIVSGCVLWLMQFIFRRTRPRLIAAAIVLALFVALVRPSPSVLRAAAMAAVMLIGFGIGAKRDAIPALGIAIAVVVLIDPWQSREAGFALSVLATAGLLLIAPKLRLPQFIAIPIAAMILCLPIIVALSGFISPISIIANIGAAPFVAPVTILGFLAALCAPISPALSSFIIAITKPFAFAITYIAHFASQFPVIEIQKGIAGFAIVLLVVVALYFFRMNAFIFLMVASFILLFIGRFPTHDWQVFACDVGQGDATVINLQHHRAILIDVGPDPELIDTCLKTLHINEISLLILTHEHADHVGGLSGVLKKRKIGAQWFGNVAQGMHATIGEYSIEVLWPLTMNAHDENPNNVSIAAVIESRDIRIFAAGDIEPIVQQQLRGRVGEVDLYKVAHHGSRYQDVQLLSELSPQVSLIEVGEGNVYRHPADSTISALEKSGSKVFRTDKDGAIAVRADDHRLEVEYDNARLHVLRIR